MKDDCLYAFDEADDALSFLPMAARRALDCAGLKLSLKGWRSLATAQRLAIAKAGVNAVTREQVSKLAAAASPAPSPIAPFVAPDAKLPPAELVEALGSQRPLDAPAWSSRSDLDRYVLVKLQRRGRGEKLARAYDEIFALPHKNAEGEARMVGIEKKAITERRAVASARVTMSPTTLQRLLSGDTSKGDVLATARIAGIQGAKKTPDLIPLCHTIALTRVAVDFQVDRGKGEVLVLATAEAMDRTGVEMEAMTAASVAALTLYDMVKSMDRWLTISTLQLEEKSGGKSGHIKRGQ